MNQKKSEKIEIVLLIVVAFLVAIFLYLVKSIWSPVLMALCIGMLLIPFRSIRVIRSVLVVLALIFFVWFIHDTRQIITPFVLSFALAYLFNPLVQKLERYKIPRWLIVLAIVLLVLGLFTLLIVFLVPQVIQEANVFIASSIEYSHRLTEWVQRDGVALLTRFNVDSSKIQEYVLKDLPGKIQKFLGTFFKSFVNVTSAISTVIGQVLNLVLIPFLFFYLLKDFQKLKNWLKTLMSAKYNKRLRFYYTRIDTVVSAFFRGQLIVCFIIAAVTSVGLLILRIDYALIIGLMAGILNLVPYVGLAITLVFGLLIGVLSPSPLIACIKIVAVIEIVQILESSFLSPRIVGNAVGLHPVAVILSILIFSHFLGFLGLLIAVPAVATLRIFLAAAIDGYKSRSIE